MYNYRDISKKIAWFMSIEKYSLLIVDDHSLSRKLLRIQLGNFGFLDNRMTECSSAKSALAFLLTHDVDIVIADWDMPEMDGLEMVQAYKRETQNAYKTAFVMVSAEAQPEKILFALNEGVVCYITKPVSQSDIDTKMKNVLDWIESREQ